MVDRKVTVRGDGAELAQDATVTLSAVTTPGLGVVIVEPVSLTQPVVPGNPETQFRFGASVSCTASGEGVVEWTATISAPGNDNPGNDTLTGTSAVICR